MSVWDSEIIEAYGNLFAYIRVQNDYTGNISGSFRRIYFDKKGKPYAKVDGSNHYFTSEVEAFNKRKDFIKNAIQVAELSRKGI